MASQVLEYVIEHISEIKMLLACSGVSIHFRAITQAFVAKQLPRLLAECLSEYDSPLVREGTSASFAWLLRVAGPDAVGTPAVARAVLQHMPYAGSQYVTKLRHAGLKLTNEVLVEAARTSQVDLPQFVAMLSATDRQPPRKCLRGPPRPAVWPQAGRRPAAGRGQPAAGRGRFGAECGQSGASSQPTASDQPAKPAALAVVDPLYVAVLCCKGQLDADVLSAANAANLQDLLYLACCAPQPVTAVEQLLEQCKDLLQLPGTGNTSTHPSSQATVLSDAASLLEGMLQWAVSKGTPDLVAAFARVPAARGLGSHSILKLLHIAIMCTHRWRMRSCSHRVPCPVTTLCGLPHAAELPAADITSLLRLSFTWNNACAVVPLLRLPCVEHMDCKVLTELCVMAGSAGIWTLDLQNELVRRLAQQPSIDQASAVALVKGCFKSCISFPHALNSLKDLQLGQHLTGDDVLELLHYMLGREHLRPVDLGDVVAVCCLSPAAEQITDITAVADCMGAALTFPWASQPNFSSLLLMMPIIQQLGTQDWFGLLRKQLKSGAGTHFCVPAGVRALPAVQQLDAEAVGQLMQGAAGQAAWKCVAQLACLPGAAQLQPGLVGSVLETVLAAVSADGTRAELLNSGCTLWRAVDALLQLPAAQQLSDDLVLGLMQAALSARQVPLEALLRKRLPSGARLASEISGQIVADVLTKAATDVYHLGILDQLATHPAVQCLSGDLLGRVVLAIISNRRAGDARAWEVLRKLPGMLRLLPAALCDIIKASLTTGSALNRTRCVDSTYFDFKWWLRLPAAAGITSKQARELLSVAAATRDICLENVRPMVQLPGVRSMDVQELAAAVEASLQSTPPKHASKQSSTGGKQPVEECHLTGHYVAGELMTLPAMQQLADVPTAGRLLVLSCELMPRVRGLSAILGLLRSPAAQRLPAGLVRRGLEAAMKEQLLAVFEALAMLPAAADCGLDIGLHKEVLRVVAADRSVLKSHKWL